MKLIGLMACRNESWCIGLSARVALLWCDELVICNHASTDGSPPDLGDMVTVLWRDGDWNEMEHRQAMLEMARHRGATHIAIVDADEVLTGNLVTCVRDQVQCLPRAFMLQLPGYNLRDSLVKFHANGIWGQRWFSVAFADDPALHWAGDNFHAREPQGMKLRTTAPFGQGSGGVMHLWGVSERRLKAKHALYKVTERLRWPDKPVSQIDQEYSWAIHGDSTNRSYGTPDRWAYSEAPASWWSPYADLMQYLDIDAEPWQEAEVRRLVAEYGPEPFSRLDLFGVA